MSWVEAVELEPVDLQLLWLYLSSNPGFCLSPIPSRLLYPLKDLLNQLLTTPVTKNEYEKANRFDIKSLN